MARNSRAYQEFSFDPGRKVAARKHFNAAGRSFKPGDDFDWRKLAVAQRRVRQMFDVGKIYHPEESQPKTKRRAAKSQPETQTVTESQPQSKDDEAFVDELDLIDDMKVLREIAESEGAKTTVSKSLQREYIRENRENGLDL